MIITAGTKNQHKTNYVLRDALRYSGLHIKCKKIIFISGNILKNITYKKVVSASRSMLRIGVHAAFLVGCVLLVV